MARLGGYSTILWGARCRPAAQVTLKIDAKHAESGARQPRACLPVAAGLSHAGRALDYAGTSRNRRGGAHLTSFHRRRQAQHSGLLQVGAAAFPAAASLIVVDNVRADGARDLRRKSPMRACTVVRRLNELMRPSRASVRPRFRPSAPGLRLLALALVILPIRMPDYFTRTAPFFSRNRRGRTGDACNLRWSAGPFRWNRIFPYRLARIGARAAACGLPTRAPQAPCPVAVPSVGRAVSGVVRHRPHSRGPRARFGARLRVLAGPVRPTHFCTSPRAASRCGNAEPRCCTYPARTGCIALTSGCP